MTAPLVLVVDDEAALRTVIAKALTRAGYRVIGAGDPERAYEALRVERPAAILLDLHLPTLSGLALYLAIVAKWPELNGRIAIMTGDAEIEPIAGWLERHPCTLLRKPFDVRELVRWVDHTVREQNRETGNA